MKTAMFRGYNSRCRHFSISTQSGPDSDCWKCRSEEELFTIKPPFNVKCIIDVGCNLKVDSEYSVVALVKSGHVPGEALPGVLLANTQGGVLLYSYKAWRFVRVD